VTEHLVTAVNSAGDQIEVSPPLDTDWTALYFTIKSAAYREYLDFINAEEDWEATKALTLYETDIQELMRVMNAVLYSARPTQAQRTDAHNAVTSLTNLLLMLSEDVLVAFVVVPVPRIDAALKMLKERALDRAYDQLLNGYVAEFFGMSKDDVAYSAYILKTMRALAQKDLPVSRYDEDGDDTTLRMTTTDTDSSFDLSDHDLDESVAILGTAAEYAEPDTESARKRY